MDYFNYLGQFLHQSDEDCLAVFRNIRKARQVLGCLGKILRREGADLILSAKFYRAVVQVVLLFGSETWVLTAAMMQKIEGVHMGFLWQVTGVKAQSLGDETW